MAASFAELIGRCCRAWDWRPAELDVGGGMPALRDPTSPTGDPAAPTAVYAEAIAGTLAAELGRRGVDPAGIALEVEPGRSLYADAGIHLTRVRGVKEQRAPIAWRWVECDTTEMFVADLLIEHARFPVRVASRAAEPPALTADVVGISCGFDVLATQVELPAVGAGDIVALLDTGAYQDACAANFNALPRPGTVLVSGDRAEWIKRPETVEQVFSRDVIPERLR
jgi:diaminopimelate decarboxylase